MPCSPLGRSTDTAPRGRVSRPARRASVVPDLHDPVRAEHLVEMALAEVARGARWVKIVADWPQGESAERRAVPSYDTATLRGVVDAAHAAGARVAAHSVSPFVADLVRLGVDSIEHGIFLDEPTLASMAARGVAWTPTLRAVTAPLPADALRSDDNASPPRSRTCERFSPSRFVWA